MCRASSHSQISSVWAHPWQEAGKEQMSKERRARLQLGELGQDRAQRIGMRTQTRFVLMRSSHSSKEFDGSREHAGNWILVNSWQVNHSFTTNWPLLLNYWPFLPFLPCPRHLYPRSAGDGDQQEGCKIKTSLLFQTNTGPVPAFSASWCAQSLLKTCTNKAECLLEVQEKSAFLRHSTVIFTVWNVEGAQGQLSSTPSKQQTWPRARWRQISKEQSTATAKKMIINTGML